MYDKLKNFLEEHKAQFMTLVACVVMFVVGFGTGKAIGRPAEQETSQQSDYTPVLPAKPGVAGEAEAEPAPVKASPTTKPAPANTADTPAQTSPTAGNDPIPGQPCLIKGNISGSDRIYHVQGGSSYEKTSPEKCFNTEAEAVAAGFRKAKR